jgi:hypothetical protein
MCTCTLCEINDRSLRMHTHMRMSGRYGLEAKCANLLSRSPKSWALLDANVFVIVH